VGSGLIEQVASGEAPPLVPLTVEQLHGMLEKGIIRDGDPMELVEGLLVRKNRAAAGEGEMTHGALHALVLTRLLKLDRRLDPFGCHLRVQLPVTLSAISEPEPDLAIVRGSLESFAGRHPGPDDLLVLVEVADRSLRYDRGAKLQVYASAGVPVYLIVNIPERQIECYEEPAAGQDRYQRRTDYRAGETLSLPLAPGRTLPLPVDDAFGSVSR
jgi:Uma2 family endonuclease